MAPNDVFPTLMMVRPTQITRRHALALGATAGLGALVRPGLTGALAAPGRAQSFTQSLPADVMRAGTTDVLHAPAEFDLLGVRGPGVVHAGLQVRARAANGRWSGWATLADAADHAPDHGTRAVGVTDPVWTGRARAFQLRIARDAGPVQVRFVRVPPRLGSVAAAAARPRAKAAGGQPAIVLRHQWGGDTIKPRSAPAFGRIDLGFVHHTETANTYLAAESPGIVLGIAHYHRDTKGWNDIGYNFLVDQFGTIFEGRAGGIDQAVIGAQAQGYNSISTGVSCIGSFTDSALPEAALDAVSRLLAWKLPLHGTPVTGTLVVVSGGGELNAHPYGEHVTLNRVSGHRDGDATDCPGDHLYHHQLPTIRARVAAYAGTVVVGAAHVSLATVPRIATYGDVLPLSGTVTSADGTAAGNAPVVVQKLGASGSWTRVASVRTQSDGTWGTQITWRAAGRLRAQATVAGSTITSAQTAIGLTPKVLLGALPARIAAGTLISVTGSVRGAATAAIVVERRVKRVWSVTTRRTVRIRRGGAFAASVRLLAAGTYRVSLHSGAAATTPVTVRATSSGSSTGGSGTSGGSKPTTGSIGPTGGAGAR